MRHKRRRVGKGIYQNLDKNGNVSSITRRGGIGGIKTSITTRVDGSNTMTTDTGGSTVSVMDSREGRSRRRKNDGGDYGEAMVTLFLGAIHGVAKLAALFAGRAVGRMYGRWVASRHRD